MYVFIIGLLLLASAHASPSEMADMPQGDVQAAASKFVYVGGDFARDDPKNVLALGDLKRQCKCGPCYAHGAPCVPYQCECIGNNGCYSCNGGKFVCQRGPGSGECIGR
ncbi:hypothetical protein E4U42_004410 [Claviceps africana]|uniref:Uncharacterized protein n=1 Tax=Claviceps africana TaxID=83212 RepID=A0A8K0J822_9HYPO|nr:hypothetical protein E4U42_004410 [Claviceps africana]